MVTCATKEELLYHTLFFCLHFKVVGGMASLIGILDDILLPSAKFFDVTVRNLNTTVGYYIEVKIIIS